MRVGLEWDTHDLAVDIASADLIEARRAAPVPALSDPAAAMRNALEEPLEFPPLRRALTPDDQVVIAVDEQVPQLATLLMPLLEHVRAAGVAAEAMTLLCVPPSTGQPWLEDISDEFQDVRVEVHQPADRRKLAYLATTKHGKRVYLNRSAVDADLLILLTRRSYDPVLGYSGAECALYPGLSDEATQQEVAAHLHAEPPGRTPWPVRREAAEVAWLLGAPFLVQVIAGVGNEVAHVLGGTVQASGEGQRLLDTYWRVTTERAADVVIAPLSGDPARLSAEDLARAFFTAARVVKPGGRLVVLTDAAPALGRSFELLRDREEPASALQLIVKEKPPDLATGFMWASAAEQARLYLLSGLPPDIVEERFATPLNHAGEVQRLLGPGTSCLVLPDAHKALASIG